MNGTFLERDERGHPLDVEPVDMRVADLMNMMLMGHLPGSHTGPEQ